MRWGSTGNSSCGIGASAYTLASRDENASYYYYQEPSAPLTVPQNQGQARRAVHAKKPPDRRPTRKVAGSNTRPSRSSVESEGPSFAGTEAADHPEGIADEPEAIKPPLIMCAGKSVYGSTSGAGADEYRSNNSEHLVSDNNSADTAHNNQTGHFRSIAAAKTNRLNEPYSPPRQRTDEELEQIIRDLRHQVFQQQQQQQQQQQNQPQQRQPVRNQHLASDADQTQKHHRKHFKNPVEKMERVAPTVPVAASIGPSSVTNSGVLLQRPLSSSYLNKAVAESTIQMVVPAIIYEAPAVTARGGCRSSGNINADGPLDFGSLRGAIPRSRPNSSSGCHAGGKQPLKPRQPRSRQTFGPIRIHREKVRGQNGDDYSSDYDDSFLYLVDAEGDEDWPESVSLSPVGPWVVDEFAAATTSGVATESPRSPTVSTCHSVSSLGSDDLECNDGGGVCEFAAMSPRSRLLYFSACVDDVEASRSMISQLQYQQTLRRSATCGSDLLGSSKLLVGTRPTRCSSAKTARHKGRSTSSASASKVSKLKSSCRSNQARKRPQNGGVGSARSTQSDGSTNMR